MNRLIYLLLILCLGQVMALEQPAYEVEYKQNKFEIRKYSAYVVVETSVSASFEKAGNIAFRRLAGYIGGNNRRQQDIAMTTPVQQSEKIKMTVPVAQRATDNDYWISFVLPSKFTFANAPIPTDERVSLTQVADSLVAVKRFSGKWTEEKAVQQLTELKSFIQLAGYKAVGEPSYARYNPPITPSFLRRHEVMLTIEKSGVAEEDS